MGFFFLFSFLILLILFKKIFIFEISFSPDVSKLPEISIISAILEYLSRLSKVKKSMDQKKMEIVMEMVLIKEQRLCPK